MSDLGFEMLKKAPLLLSNQWKPFSLINDQFFFQRNSKLIIQNPNEKRCEQNGRNNSK